MGVIAAQTHAFMNLTSYVEALNRRYVTGRAREHSYRPDLQNLLETLTPDYLITNEPARIDCGAPDYVITSRDNVPVGYIEAKDIGVDLGAKSLREQFGRYKASLDNLIITDYLTFEFYAKGELTTKLSIAELQGGRLVPIPSQFKEFEDLVKAFVQRVSQTITSSETLSKLMAAKARLLANVIQKALESDEQSNANTELKAQMKAFADILIHDIAPPAFADIYAQTIAYGMFAARLNDPTPDTFTRQEAASLIPKSNPFLRKLFQHIAGYDLDTRIVWIVDDLATIFRATDVDKLMEGFGKSTGMEDPVIHFYENFLSEYNPELRKSRGVWYTPAPVVKFMVQAVDDILKSEFGLKAGLADTSKTKVEVKAQGTDRRYKDNQERVTREVHRVQILDPATGTGTFLAEIVKYIYNARFRAMQGMWNGYVERDLIPRLHGFELLMASYAMAHLKLEMLLQETGYKPTNPEQRLRVFLTNSLEESHPDTGTLFANWLSQEASEANTVKRDAPVMVVIGNPPYSGESANKGEWIMQLMEDYKREPGGKEKLKERNPKWINDDYVKFMRYAQHFIQKNGEGVLAYINPHGFLDNPTFRGMRWHLLQTFDKVYTIDLHGNSKKKETAPDGGPDVNVFDIQQGVSINLLIKTGRKKANQLGQVFHYDLYGGRDEKYRFLESTKLSEMAFAELPNRPPMYFMVQKDFASEKAYEKGFGIKELFPVNSAGIVTARDALSIHMTQQVAEEVTADFAGLPVEDARRKYNLGKDAKEWQASWAQKDIKESQVLRSDPTPISYRPFDYRWTYYTGKAQGFHCRPRKEVMQHFLKGENVGLVTARSNKSPTCDHFFMSDKIIETKLGERTTQSAVFPLYLYESDNLFGGAATRRPNLDGKIVAQVAKGLGLRFTPEVSSEAGTFAPIHLLDYIYAVLHAPSYRETYKEFLKIDFPRVPYPRPQNFWALVELGSQLRAYHLMTHEGLDDFLTSYPQDGDNVVTRKMTQKSIGYEPISETHGRVWINDAQYFDGVPLVAWEFYIGGYQPAQKWLKDRHGRELNYEDLIHYQRIIVALTKTEEIMSEVDEVLVL